MVLMHLGLIDGPFVPLNLISTQESPVPLLKFQMVPRLKIVIVSGSKKKPRYTFLFSQKSWQMNFLRVSQQREACLQGILLISQKPHFSGSPAKEPSFKVPLMESLAERCPRAVGNWGSVIQFSVGTRDLSLFQIIWIGSGAYPAAYSVGDRGPLCRGKVAGA